eukprot:110829-Chlamydomonas_euryale.AAC.1
MGAEWCSGLGGAEWCGGLGRAERIVGLGGAEWYGGLGGARRSMAVAGCALPSALAAQAACMQYGMSQCGIKHAVHSPSNTHIATSMPPPPPPSCHQHTANSTPPPSCHMNAFALHHAMVQRQSSMLVQRQSS